MKTTRLETRTKEFWSYASVMVQVKPKTRSESKYTIYLLFIWHIIFVFSLCFSFPFLVCERVLVPLVCSIAKRERVQATGQKTKQMRDRRREKHKKKENKSESTIPRSGTFYSPERVQKK